MNFHIATIQRVDIFTRWKLSLVFEIKDFRNLGRYENFQEFQIQVVNLNSEEKKSH